MVLEILSIVASIELHYMNREVQLNRLLIFSSIINYLIFVENANFVEGVNYVVHAAFYRTMSFLSFSIINSPVIMWIIHVYCLQKISL